jgi:hypothetical protein
MNLLKIVISIIVLSYIISYFMTRFAILKSESYSDTKILHICFFIPFVNIITPLFFLIICLSEIDANKFFKIKK